MKRTIIGTPNHPNQDYAVVTDESCSLTNAVRSAHVTGAGVTVTLPPNPLEDQTHAIVATGGDVTLAAAHTINGSSTVTDKTGTVVVFSDGQWVPSSGGSSTVIPKEDARVLSDSNLALSGFPIIDTVQTVDDDRVVANGQTDPTENGIWVAAAGAWTRADDLATGSHAQNAYVFIAEGADYGDTGWLCDTDAPNDVVGTDPISFIRFTFPLATVAPVNVTKAAAAVGTS